MKQPGPDHPITLEENPRRVVVRFAGRVVADTTRALTLREASYPPVQYVPREDAEMTLLRRTDHATHCPYKGDASYYTIAANGRAAEDSGENAARDHRSNSRDQEGGRRADDSADHGPCRRPFAHMAAGCSFACPVSSVVGQYPDLIVGKARGSQIVQGSLGGRPRMENADDGRTIGHISHRS